jgi:demethylspheroidene O-methyltransferase
VAEVAGAAGPRRRGFSLGALRNRLVASRGFQRFTSGFPLTRGIARADGARLFDLLAGFTHSQVLMAVVELELPAKMMDGPRSAAELAAAASVPPERMATLLDAGVALGLFTRSRRGAYGLSRLGAALEGVPGLKPMIRHHRVLYRDLADPAAFFRGETETELAGFWPYVFGAAAAEDPDTARIYSGLMAESQVLVAEDTLRAVRFAGVEHLLDIGGGTGAFLEAVGRATAIPRLTLFDLPAVVPDATRRFAAAGLAERVRIVPGSFRDDPLPEGADTISLVRVLYDHADATVAELLARVFEALPPGGRLIVSEPMRGARRPERAGDVYFSLYCMAMRTGRARTPGEIAALARAAGFTEIASREPARPYVTRVLSARRPV